MVLLLTAMGVVFFRESLNYYEIAGLTMAIASLILLVRFAQRRALAGELLCSLWNGVRVGLAERFLQDFYLIPRRTRRK